MIEDAERRRFVEESKAGILGAGRAPGEELVDPAKIGEVTELVRGRRRWIHDLSDELHPCLIECQVQAKRRALSFLGMGGRA
jgi:hypothetical protein